MNIMRPLKVQEGIYTLYCYEAYAVLYLTVDTTDFQSSLLMALLGELPLSEGKVKVNGKVAYVSQQPWVFSASVRQNILFGQKYDKERYIRAIKAAALSRVSA